MIATTNLRNLSLDAVTSITIDGRPGAKQDAAAADCKIATFYALVWLSKDERVRSPAKPVAC